MDASLATRELHPFVTTKALEKYLESDAARSLTLRDMSYLLFVCNDEQVQINGCGVYAVPGDGARVRGGLDARTGSHHWHHNQYGTGPLPYSGLYGVIPAVKTIIRYNVLDHPLLDNLRAGDWLLDYLLDRLRARPALQTVAELIAREFDHIRKCPRSLKPVDFCRFMVVLDVCVELGRRRRSGRYSARRESLAASAHRPSPRAEC